MLVAQQLKHLHGLEFAFLLALGLCLLVKFWGCKRRLLLQDVDGYTHTHAQQQGQESHESKPSTACTSVHITSVIKGVYSTTVPQTLTALQEQLQSLHRTDSTSPAHRFINGLCCPLLGSAVKT